jgi:hypothetical protein
MPVVFISHCSYMRANRKTAPACMHKTRCMEQGD